MIEDLVGKAILVTGASTGIGAAAAAAFGRNKARVAVHCHRSRDAAEGVAAGIRAAGGEAVVLQGDVSRTAEAARMVEETVAAFGRLDVLVNNAGDMIQRMPLADASDELLRAQIDLNVMSVMAACRAAVPHFRRQGGGVIINVSSIAARFGGGLGAIVYGSTKAFVSNLTRGLARELAVDNVRVNAVSPGTIATPFHVRHSKEEMLKATAATIPMGRLGTPEECAGTFLYLASQEMSGYVNGQTIEVNGGQWMN